MDAKVIRLNQWTPPSLGGPPKPALVVGKGPTVNQIGKLNLDDYRVFTLNHAIDIVPMAVGAHFVDLEAYLDCKARVVEAAHFVFMPDRPHEKMTQGRPIEELLLEHPSLHLLASSGRLIVYRKKAAPAWTVANARDAVSCLYFSAEALFGVLGIIGFTEVHTIGIDGGTAYGSQFSKLTPLTNGRASFDIQMGELKKIADIRKFRWTRLFPEAIHA